MSTPKYLLVLTVVLSLFSGILGGTLEDTLRDAPGGGVLQGIEQKSREILKLSEVEEESETIAVVEKASPSVVSIVVSKEVAVGGSPFPFDDEFFRQFGFQFELPQPKSVAPQKRTVGAGTGFVISEDGMILTNRHVVADEAAEYTAVFNDGKEFPAKVLARDPFIDLAVVKIEATGLLPLPLGRSDDLQIGQTVIAIGNALSEFQNTVTKGVVSGINRRVVAGDSRGGSEVIEEAIQTDAAINPGNSGGPLLNLRGEVIGMNSAVSRQGQLIGFAIPINSAKRAIESVKAHGRIVRPHLGVRYVIVTAALAKENKLPREYGALIVRGDRPTDVAIVPGSPADKAGLKENDIILELDGVKIDEAHSLASQIGKKQPGDAVTLKVFRKDAGIMVRATLEELK